MTEEERAELEEYRSWIKNRKGLEDYFAKVEELRQANLERDRLKQRLNMTFTWMKDNNVFIPDYLKSLEPPQENKE